MPTTYEKPPIEVRRLMNAIVAEHHKDLSLADVSIEILFARAERDDDGVRIGTALKVHGVPALGRAKIVGLVDRAKGCRDAEITLDADHWDNVDEDEQKALLDHELHHLVVQWSLPPKRPGDEGPDFEPEPKRDSAGRPKLRMRKHDYEIGHFHAIAERHGQASQEVQQLRRILETSTGQIAWAWAAGTEVKLVAAGGGARTKSTTARRRPDLAAVEE